MCWVQCAPEPALRAIRFAGAQRYLVNDDNLLGAVGGEKDAVVADPTAIHTFPFVSLESFDVSLKRVCCHLRRYPRDAFLNCFRQGFEILRRLGRELKDPTHA